MATQKGRNWSSGDIVTAANLSSIERGVSAVAEEYTPTTWANGNTVTAAGLNNIEQGIVNAGSNSDFSTAQVTITNNSLEAVPITIAQTMNNMVIPYLNAQPSNPYNLSVVLYKGVSACIPFGAENISVSGNAQLIDGAISITGDCTITISNESSGGDR